MLEVQSVKLVRNSYEGDAVNFDGESYYKLDFNDYKDTPIVCVRVDYDIYTEEKGNVSIRVSDGDKVIHETEPVPLQNPDVYIVRFRFERPGVYKFEVVYDGIPQERVAQLTLT